MGQKLFWTLRMTECTRQRRLMPGRHLFRIRLNEVEEGAREEPFVD